MNIVLYNDTRNVDNNPGCKATINGLINLLNLSYPNSDIECMPYGIFSSYFTHISSYRPKGGLAKIKSLFFRQFFSLEEEELDFYFYRNFLKKVKKLIEIQEFKTAMFDKELVVINMEGTVHHNTLQGITLIGIAYAAHLSGKKVFLLNGSIQKMSKQLLKNTFNRIDYIAVREIISHTYLNELNIKNNLALDCAFLSKITENQSNIFTSKGKRCLYTTGVILAYSQQHNIENPIEIIENHVSSLKNKGYEVFFLKIEENESLLEPALQALDVSIIDMNDYDWNMIGSILAEFELIVSGRYHIIIFCIMMNIPFIPIESNTWKIEGLFKTLNKDIEIQKLTNSLDDIMPYQFLFTDLPKEIQKLPYCNIPNN
ncbi:hypothetical protein Fleli_0226 [Bernardetia litoralis DSM 6794]|uniref:Polysaccharide pyruvyl transferase domain-containing protein n=1 Tax=Bernardetia litoralis (strain ATCC 23117 / DSM 6794 / NBRC 15988 / NCIMB 1366 / Fx l1 / Sio-4) TaxID=880071 RepID=I4AFI6_BERLS|nr:polysaccharide pyruvyl transferase family protein [Bernardetia litoralis]AFM02721.1 hypothetical protein Fleli_0226 [Bernardetia litoralis DSM 6794]